MRASLVAASVTAAAVGLPLLVLQRWVAETRTAAMAMVAAFFVLFAIGVVLLCRRRPDLRLPVAGTFVLIVVATVGIGWWTGFRDNTVDEDVVMASMRAEGDERDRGLSADERPARRSVPVELASGRFTGKDGHAGRGTATVVRRDGKRVLTFTRFDVDPGADVRVYLTPGDGSDVDDRVDLGGLKGNVGDQQYAIPADADLRRYSTVVLWCRPFTVRIATAPLS